MKSKTSQDVAKLFIDAFKLPEDTIKFEIIVEPMQLPKLIITRKITEPVFIDITRLVDTVKVYKEQYKDYEHDEVYFFKPIYPPSYGLTFWEKLDRFFRAWKYM